MGTSMWHYKRALAEQLRVNGVREPRVREIVAQVEAHVDATGEDPVAAFGQPVDYAAQWQPLGVRHWSLQVLASCLVAVGLAGAIPAVMSGVGWRDEVPVTTDDLHSTLLMVGVLAFIPWTSELWLSRRRASRLGTPSRPVEWPVRVVAALGFGLFAWAVAHLWGGTGEDTVVVMDAPRWLLVAGGVAAVWGVTQIGRGPGSATLPRPPGDTGGVGAWGRRVLRVLSGR